MSLCCCAERARPKALNYWRRSAIKNCALFLGRADGPTCTAEMLTLPYCRSQRHCVDVDRRGRPARKLARLVDSSARSITRSIVGHVAVQCWCWGSAVLRPLPHPTSNAHIPFGSCPKPCGCSPALRDLRRPWPVHRHVVPAHLQRVGPEAGRATEAPVSSWEPNRVGILRKYSI